MNGEGGERAEKDVKDRRTKDADGMDKESLRAESSIKSYISYPEVFRQVKWKKNKNKGGFFAIHTWWHLLVRIHESFHLTNSTN